MELEGGCYCGAIRYKITGDAQLKGQCHCRECQYGSGGGANYFMVFGGDNFEYIQGKPKEFTRSDLESPVTRQFCGNCGTQLVSRAPGLPGAAILKAGTLDDPSQFGDPQMAIYTIDKQPFHHIPEGVPSFERSPS